MSRTRSFDESSVLTKAMHVFRRKGFGAVSVADLEKSTGLTVGSLYNAFGDKQGIFDAAFGHYNRNVLEARLARYAPATAGVAGLRRLFLTLLEEPNNESFGCLITNSAIEFGGKRSAHPCVSEAFEILATTFTARLREAQRLAILREGIDPVATSAKLLALYQGILVLVRGTYDKSRLKHLITSEFNDLEKQK